MAESKSAALLDQMVGEDLSGVTFVRDYIQLQFNPPPTFNVYGKCTIRKGGAEIAFGSADFPNAIISLIGQVVVAACEVPRDRVEIRLANGACISIFFGLDTFVGPEACEFLGRNNAWGVWP